MKKNGFLTFIFACIPGAGQMYYGYMQRGLSIAMILILCVMAATVVEPLLFLCLVIWMYSFFDAYDIITGIPNVVIAALLIFAGLKLLGLHPETKHGDDELPPYPHE